MTAVSFFPNHYTPDVTVGRRARRAREGRAYRASVSRTMRPLRMLRHWYNYDPGSLEKAILRELADVVPDYPIMDCLVPAQVGSADYCLLALAVCHKAHVSDLGIMVYDTHDTSYYRLTPFLSTVVRAFDMGLFPDWMEEEDIDGDY